MDQALRIATVVMEDKFECTDCCGGTPLESPSTQSHSGGMSRRRFAAAAGFFAAAATDLVQLTHPVVANDLSKTVASQEAIEKLSRQAISDYQANMRQFGGGLSTDPSQLLNKNGSGKPWQFDVVVIGSGYGASVIAARLAGKLKKGNRLCVLERGEEWVPGTFSSSNVKQPFRLRNFDNLSVLESNGLGGGSLIDPGSAARPDARVFEQSRWPEQLRDRAFIDSYYDLAELELGMKGWSGSRAPDSERLAAASMRLSARGADLESPLLSITQGPSNSRIPILNREGMLQRGCIGCGECWKGCNVGAKNTLAMNYLTKAKKLGGDLFTRTEVQCIEKTVDYYRVHINQIVTDPSGKVTIVPQCITCRILVLGAGSIGSTEILLRSQGPHLSFSSQLGNGWNTNGDIIGLIGAPASPGEPNTTMASQRVGGAGPMVQTSLSYSNRSDFTKGVTIVAGNSSSSLNHFMQMSGADADANPKQLFLGMGHGQSEGVVRLDSKGSAVVHWKGDAEYEQRMLGEMARVAETTGTRLHYTSMTRQPILHAMGGCCLADSPDQGVVNHKGQVFDTVFGGDQDRMTRQFRVHEGLYVCDSSIIPTSLGCTPQLTIASLAERTAQLIVLETKYADIFDL